MKWIGWLLPLFFMVSCGISDEQLAVLKEPGVSHELAQYRARNFLHVKYKLDFNIPKDKKDPVTGVVVVSWSQGGKHPLVIDFRGDSTQIYSFLMNGIAIDYEIKDEHIYIPPLYTLSGTNEVTIAFKAADQSLNRRDEFLYTLLVPDRARTLFPCFDQPDIKAKYSLSLSIPDTWKAVSNGKIEHIDSLSHPGRHVVSFKETEPLPTYLFSFVAGKLKREIFSRGERSISIYHRETDPDKKAQCPEIARQVLDALEWQEDFTQIPYPFAKYDLIILPGFQFGGMEHTGATLYNDNSMFLNPNPTLDEQLRRSSLIAHETAHMWFGDYVTMKWFDDVWTKVVFANYFAAQIVKPFFPTVNHQLNFMRAYVPAAYSEDRTLGSTPIQQELGNLRNAGLVYSNIIYNKSPMVMDMIVKRMGWDNFRKGIHDYLKSHAYGNATWDDLIASLSKFSDQDLEKMSQAWVKEKGMPVLNARLENKSLVVEETDTWKRGLVWPQKVKYRLIEKDVTEDVFVEINDSMNIAKAELKHQFTNPVILPNVDGRGYGYFQMSETDVKGAFRIMQSTRDDLLKGSLLISLNENLQNWNLDVDAYMHSLADYLKNENNDLLYSMALGYLSTATRFSKADNLWLEDALWNQVTAGAKPQFRLQSFRQYLYLVNSDEAENRLYEIWKSQNSPEGCNLSERDYISMSYELAIRMPEKANDIVKEQLSRITNPDRKEQYRFISPAVSPYMAVRDSMFKALQNAENRRIEPWVSTSMALLNHRLRQHESVGFINGALNVLQEVQRTGDIFFPTAWLRSLLGGHVSENAIKEVETFWSEHPDYSPMLSSKIRQQSDHLYRLNKKNK